jgi:cell shape-determining protein MreD
MNRVLPTILGAALFYLLLAVVGFQSALPAPWLFLPVPGLFVLAGFLFWGLERGLLAALVVGFGADLYLPFPFGTYLVAFPLALLTLYFLFRTIFAHQTAFSTLIVIGGGVFLSESYAWGAQRLIGFLSRSGETLALSSELVRRVALETVAAVAVSLALQGLWRLAVRPLWNRFFTNVNRYAAR